MQVESAIYSPPKPDFPYLVVTLAPSGVNVLTATNRTEARKVISQLTRGKAASGGPRSTSNDSRASGLR
jgi:hypothetical protein